MSKNGRGRPRRKGIVGPDGKRLRQSQAKDGSDKVREVVALRRCREAGLRPTEANKRRVMASNYGTELGKLVEAKRITQEQANAGFRYAELEVDYARMMGLPRRHAQAAAYGAVRGGSTKDSQAYIDAVLANHHACRSVLAKMAPLQQDLLVSICVDNNPLPDSRRALAALDLALVSLERHFGGFEKRTAA